MPPTSPAQAVQPSFEQLGTPLIATTFVVLDLETTGLSAERDRITEIGAVKVRGGEVIGELATLVRPPIPIPAAVSAVTGITDAMVRHAPPIGAVLPSVWEFLGDAVLVAHNARFDVAFLRAAYHRHDGRGFEPLVVDTARLARRLLADEVRNVRLATLAAHLRATTRPEHRALTDARATVDVLHGLIERAGAYGATTLEDLRDLSRSTSSRAFRQVDLVRDAPRTAGTYRFLGPDGEVLYVGKATQLRSRLRTYFGQDPRRRIADLVRDTAAVTWTETPTLLEAEVRELRAIRAHRPRYNRRSKRPEAAVHLALTREPFPRLSIVRDPRSTHRRTLGPLPSRRVAEEVAEAVHEVFRLRTCTPRLRRAQDHPACVLKELDRCGAPCDGTQTSAGYDTVVTAVETALEDPTELLAGLRTRMLDLGREGRFERAMQLRSRLHTTARAVAAARRRDALGTVAELVLARGDRDATEIVVLRHGRLAGSLRLAPGATDETILAELAACELEEHPTPPSRDDAEEVGLLLAWIDGDGGRIVAADGCWAEPAAGGRVLAETVAEGRRVARAVRRDRQALSGAKVSRRSSTEPGAAGAAAPVT